MNEEGKSSYQIASHSNSILHEYNYVKEFEEGINRMYREMANAGLPDSEYRTVEFMVYATLKNHKWVESRTNPEFWNDAIPKLIMIE